jgi:hypothetical protein
MVEPRGRSHSSSSLQQKQCLTFPTDAACVAGMCLVRLDIHSAMMPAMRCVKEFAGNFPPIPTVSAAAFCSYFIFLGVECSAANELSLSAEGPLQRSLV